MSSARNTNIPACYLVLIRDEKVLLMQRKDTGYMDGWYSFIAGHVDEGESFTQGIIREALEEAGLKLQAENLRASHVMQRNSDDSVRGGCFFHSLELARLPGKTGKPHKCSDLSWFSLNELPEKTIPYIRGGPDLHSGRQSPTASTAGRRVLPAS